MAIVADKSMVNPYIDAHIERPYVIVRQGKTTTTDRNFTATTASQQLMAANPRRQSMYIRNDTAIVVWIEFGPGPAVAVAGGGSIPIAANGGSFTSTDQRAVQIISASATADVTASETV